MIKSRLLATVTASLLLGVGAASAQSMNSQAPERAPAAQQNAPAEKVAPPLKSGERKGSETTGQSTHESSPGASSGGHATQEMKRGDEKTQGTTGQAPKNAAPDSERSGAADKDRGTTTKSRSDDKNGANMNRSEERSNRSEERSGSPRSGQSATEEKSRSTTTGQGAASGSAKLSTEQRTKITTVIRKHKVQPTTLNVSVRVGTRIPASVRFHPLPVEVVEIYPEWRGFDYILVGDQIVVIEPGTHEIVAVLDA